MGNASSSKLKAIHVNVVKGSSADKTFQQTRFVAPSAGNLVQKQVRGYAEAKASPTEVSSILEQRIRGVSEEASLAETGRVLSVGYDHPSGEAPCAIDIAIA